MLGDLANLLSISAGLLRLHTGGFEGRESRRNDVRVPNHARCVCRLADGGGFDEGDLLGMRCRNLTRKEQREIFVNLLNKLRLRAKVRREA